MRCDRLEGEALLAELGGELYAHVEQCPDCSARIRGYRRVASWIAEGKALHRAPSGWQGRTLARVLATSSPVPTSVDEPSHEVEDPTTPCVLAGIELHRASPARSSDTALAASAGARVPVPKAQHRKRWSRVVFPIATAASMLVIASSLLLSGDERAPNLAMRSESPGATPLEPAPSAHTPPAPPPSQASSPPTQPTVPANDPQMNDPQTNDPQASDPQGTADPVAIKLPGRRAGAAPAGEGIPDRMRTRRGGPVTVDWDENPTPAPVGPAAIEVVIETIPPGAQVIVGGNVLGTTPLRRSVPRDGELVLRLHGYRDVAVVASRHASRPIELVPLEGKTDDARDGDRDRMPAPPR